jgi:squalene-hopene/tetraprenyl-beta-curcumene cyclase
MKATWRGKGVLATCLLGALFVGCSRPATKGSDSLDHSSGAANQPEAGAASSWDQKSAAAYLDQREGWWMEWPGAARDHETFCVSCHTSVPYALSRPALRAALGEKTPSVDERRLLDNVRKRVRLWNDMGPFYDDHLYGVHKTAESRGTEAVLNALILASYDAQNGELSDDTRTAFNNMWALQQTTGDQKGAWAWLQFGLEPWEASESQYYGATLAAIAAGTAPDNYKASPEIQGNLKALREYLGREYGRQSLENDIVLLWASAKLPGLLEPEQQKSIIGKILSKQQADGGWSLASLHHTWRGWHLSAIARMWVRSDGTLYETNSDGYATGLIALTLQQVGIPHENVHLKQGLAWLARNQNKAEGLWPCYSLNVRRIPSSSPGRFMSDAATAYAVLALTKASSH